MFTADVPVEDNVLIATFSDDTALLCSDKSQTEADSNLRRSVNKIVSRCKKWQIKIITTTNSVFDFDCTWH